MKRGDGGQRDHTHIVALESSPAPELIRAGNGPRHSHETDELVLRSESPLHMRPESRNTSVE